MLARLRKSVEENDEGFTLIELLVVMIIIGILAAIAIPVFLNQRKKAVDSSMKSDLRTVANAVETYYTDAQSYSAINGRTGTGSIDFGASNVAQLSNGNTLTVETTTNGFCIEAVRTAAASASSKPNPQSDAWVYKSDAGGIQPASVVSC